MEDVACVDHYRTFRTDFFEAPGAGPFCCLIALARAS